MFHPTSNRLAGFLEISALSIQLAQSGGWQAKAGLLTIEPASKKSGGFGRRNASWSDKKKQRWCALREGYLVAVEDPAEVSKYNRTVSSYLKKILIFDYRRPYGMFSYLILISKLNVRKDTIVKVSTFFRVARKTMNYPVNQPIIAVRELMKTLTAL